VLSSESANSSSSYTLFHHRNCRRAAANGRKGSDLHADFMIMYGTVMAALAPVQDGQRPSGRHQIQMYERIMRQTTGRVNNC
jgi:hypothetical protein